MRCEGDARVAAAKRWLQRRLEEAFSNTSFYCRSKFAEFQYPPVTTGEGDPVVRHAVREFRERSLECIPEGFNRLLEAIRTLQQDAGDDLADIAKNLTWEAIDKTFNWTAGDRSNSSRFEDWTTQAEANFEVMGGVVMVSPECNNMPNASLADQLNCDFRTQFERLLNQLRDEAFLDTGTAKPTNTTPAAAAYDPGAPKPYSDDPDLKDEDPRKRGIARARLVQHVREELDYFRPIFTDIGRSDLEQMALQHNDQIIFQERRRGKLLLCWDNCYDLLKKMAFKKLAAEIGAAKACVAPSTMETAWKDYHKFLDSENK
jgi:hypothetical protein